MPGGEPGGEPGDRDPAVPDEPGATVPGGGDLNLDMLMAALRADATDIAIYARVLTESLGDAMPPGCVSVDRERSVSDRMRGRPGAVSKITVRLGDRVLSLGVQRGAPAAEICREVRGVVLSRQPVPLGEWISELARALMAHAEQNAQTAAALRRLVTGGPGTEPG
ncbi:MAG: hypothetical protein ACRDNZ_21315 [Streptosporangiaceae bacterium]